MIVQPHDSSLPGPGEWDRFATAYAQRVELQPPEHVLLDMLAGEWHSIDMLDLGVGAGRTAHTFAALTRSYVGVDYSPEMVESSRRLVAESPTVLFDVADARDLSRFSDGQFGLVLFSFNGIDNVGHEDRLKILAQIRRVVRADGIFAFSTHSLHGLPLPAGLHRSELRRLGTARLGVRRVLRARAFNRRVVLTEALANGWQVLVDLSGFRQYYVAPKEQLRQLEAADFAVVRTLAADGSDVEPANPGSTPHPFYICRPASR